MHVSLFKYSNLEENKCRSCDTLKAELHKAQQDITTYKKL